MADIATAQQQVLSDRTLLTFRDSGLYCNYSLFERFDTVKDQPESEPNMLGPKRAIYGDVPWSFYILQFYPDSSRVKDPPFLEEMTKHGRKIILRVFIGKKENLNLIEAKRLIAKALQTVNPELLYAITLGEENVYWGGNTPILRELYKWCKRKWPDLPVYQWWTPNEVPDVRATSGWVALPADGWVMDLYGVPRERFEKQLVKALETGKPVIDIVYASPTQPAYLDEGDANRWWDDYGKKIFYQQIGVCRAYNVPVAYFCLDPGERQAGKVLRRCCWGWCSPDIRVRNFFNWLEAYVRNFKLYSDDTVGYRKLTKELLDWAHSPSPKKSPVSFDVDDQNNQRVSLVFTPHQISCEPGRHKIDLPTMCENIEAIAIFDDSVKKLNKWLGLSGVSAQPVQVPLTFEIKCPGSGLVDIQADVKVKPDAGGSVVLMLSHDGKKWEEAAKSNVNTPINQKLKASMKPGPDGVFFVRVTLCADGNKTDKGFVSKLNVLKISCIYHALAPETQPATLSK